MNKRRLPPLNGLRAFEAAARLGSFAAAGLELAVTPGAVSQRVKMLEDRMGVVLFERHPQSLSPTKAARALLPVLTEAFDAIAATAWQIQIAATSKPTPLHVVAPAGFAAGWLMPRLDRFSRREPAVTLTLTATERLIEPASEASSEEIGACIRFGRAGWRGDLGCDFLFADRRIPVCSPSYALAHPFTTGSPDPLAGHRLLEALSSPGDWADWMIWSRWPAQAAQRLSFGDERLTLEAAIRGLGIALADRALAADALFDGRLVAPVEPLEMCRGTAWFLVYPAAGSEAAAAFRAWLLEESRSPR